MTLLFGIANIFPLQEHVDDTDTSSIQLDSLLHPAAEQIAAKLIHDVAITSDLIKTLEPKVHNILLLLAIIHDREGLIIREILQAGVNPNTRFAEKLQITSSLGGLKKSSIAPLHLSISQIKTINVYEPTALHQAIIFNNLPAVKILYELGADLLAITTYKPKTNQYRASESETNKLWATYDNGKLDVNFYDNRPDPLNFLIVALKVGNPIELAISYNRLNIATYLFDEMSKAKILTKKDAIRLYDLINKIYQISTSRRPFPVDKEPWAELQDEIAIRFQIVETVTEKEIRPTSIPETPLGRAAYKGDIVAIHNIFGENPKQNPNEPDISFNGFPLYHACRQGNLAEEVKYSLQMQQWSDEVLVYL